MRLVAAALVSGLLYGLSFPPFHFHFLAWMALVPLFISLRIDPQGCFYRGFLCGFIANIIIFSWLWKTFEAAHIAAGTTVGVWVALAALLALYFGVFAWAHGNFPELFIRPWTLAFFWAGLEGLRSFVLTGFPWALLGHTQAYFGPILQLASVTGVLGISFVVVLVNQVLADVVALKKISTIIQSFLVAALVGSLGWWGQRRIEAMQMELKGARKIKVAILQGNIDQYQKWDEKYEAGIRHTYEGLIEEAAASKPDVIIWPESALPGWFPNQTLCALWVEKVTKHSGVDNLVGAVTSRNKNDFNAMFHFNKNGRAVEEYDKQHLVPFGEYVPFGGFLKKWIPYLGQVGTFEAGQSPVLFDVAGIKFGPNICYEAMFPCLVHESVRRGTQIIVNVTNDGWFLDTGAPEQHYVANIFRAVENGWPVVRAGNTGISAVIDPTGREIMRTPLLATGAFTADVPVKGFDTIFSLLYSRLCHVN